MDQNAIIRFRAAYEALAAVDPAELGPMRAQRLARLKAIGRLHVIRLDALGRTTAPQSAKIPILGRQNIRGLGAASWYDWANENIGALETATAQDVGQAWDWVKGEASSLWQDASAPVENAYHQAVQSVSSAIDDAQRSVGGTLQSIGDRLDQDIVQPVRNWTDNATGFLQNIGAQIGGAATKVGEVAGIALLGIGALFVVWLLRD